MSGEEEQSLNDLLCNEIIRYDEIGDLYKRVEKTKLSHIPNAYFGEFRCCTLGASSVYHIDSLSNKIKLGKHYKKLSDGKDIVLWYYEKDEKWRIASGERFKEKLTLYLFI